MLCCLADVMQLEGGVEDLFEHRNVEHVACRVSVSAGLPSLMQRAVSIEEQRALGQGKAALECRLQAPERVHLWRSHIG